MSGVRIAADIGAERREVAVSDRRCGCGRRTPRRSGPALGVDAQRRVGRPQRPRADDQRAQAAQQRRDGEEADASAAGAVM